MGAGLVHAAARTLHRAGLLTPLIRVATAVSSRSAFSILPYHRVNDDRDPFFPAVPTAVFEQQMTHVARTAHVMPLEELVTRQARGALPRNALAITFDDGYRDNLVHAAPILRRLGLPATVFVATGFIGTAETPWWDRLALALKETSAVTFTAPWGHRFPLDSPAARLNALQTVQEHLKGLWDDERQQCLAACLEGLGAPDAARFRNLMLTWEDVRALGELGIGIGAHTVNHVILSRVSAERARSEILGSREMVEAGCGVVPRAFAYPNGRPADYTEAVLGIVRDAGFTCAVTTRFGLNTPATSPWELRRGGPWEEDAPTFALKLAWYRAASRE